MRTTLRPRVATLAALLALGLAACAPGGGTELTGGAPPAGEPAEQVAPADPAVAVVHKSPTCDCCGGHELYLAAAGYVTDERLHEEDLREWKEARGIPRDLWSCHTTEVGGYLVEGHVPAETIALLLEERPDIDGIALPGMPAGSPGMGGEQAEPWVIEAFVDGEPAGVFDTR